MPDGIRETVHDEESVSPARHDEVRRVVGGLRRLGQEIARAVDGEILDPPRRPEVFQTVRIRGFFII
jgi:hypothetical protein